MNGEIGAAESTYGPPPTPPPNKVNRWLIVAAVSACGIAIAATAFAAGMATNGTKDSQGSSQDPQRRPLATSTMNRPGFDGGSGYWFPTPAGSVCWAA